MNIYSLYRRTFYGSWVYCKSFSSLSYAKARALKFYLPAGIEFRIVRHLPFEDPDFIYYYNGRDSSWLRVGPVQRV